MSINWLSGLPEQRRLRVERMLREMPLMWLSTVRPGARPHLVPVWFLWHGDEIVIFSKPDVKIRNLAENAAVALGLSDLEGNEVVLLAGTATVTDRGLRAAADAPFASKYARQIAENNWTAEGLAAEYTKEIRVRVDKVTAF